MAQTGRRSTQNTGHVKTQEVKTQHNVSQQSSMARGGGLKGMRQENGSALYLRNIAVEEETDDVIGIMVKDYARKRNIRIMKFKIIRYRACCDTVGCRIIVPTSQEHKALDPSTWPTEVTCRRWERQAEWLKSHPKKNREALGWTRSSNAWENRYSGDAEEKNAASHHRDDVDRYYTGGDDYYRDEKWE